MATFGHVDFDFVVGISAVADQPARQLDEDHVLVRSRIIPLQIGLHHPADFPVRDAIVNVMVLERCGLAPHPAAPNRMEVSPFISSNGDIVPGEVSRVRFAFTSRTFPPRAVIVLAVQMTVPDDDLVRPWPILIEVEGANGGGRRLITVEYDRLAAHPPVPD